MKNPIPRTFLAGVLAALSALAFVSPSNAEDLTPQQVESLKKKLAEMKDKLDGRLSSRNKSAGDRFLEAATDKKKAVDLYFEAHKLVNYERKGRKDSDYRAWKEKEEETVKTPEFIESLQIQLRYLGMSCKAAEVDAADFHTIFKPLTDYVDGLSRLSEMPQPLLMQSVAGSVFSKAYYLEKLLGKNDSWEPVPYNIEGIYNKTILPYLREEGVDSLMSAWDLRIEQQTRLVEFLEAQKLKEVRGLDRDDERRTRDRQENAGGIRGKHDKEKFLMDTLPSLQWSKLVDMFTHVDAKAGALAMLAFLDQHTTHHLAEDWLGQMIDMIDGQGDQPSTPAAEPATPTTNPAGTSGPAPGLGFE